MPGRTKDIDIMVDYCSTDDEEIKESHLCYLCTGDENAAKKLMANNSTIETADSNTG